MLAVPLGALDSVLSLAGECDEVVCLATPQPFYSVGTHYQNFTPVSDKEVKRLLGQADGFGDDRAMQNSKTGRQPQSTRDAA